MKLIYIAGPYRNPDHLTKYQNILRARDAAAYWLTKGWAVHCPHSNTANFDGVYPDIPAKTYLLCGLELLARSDAVYFLRGWESSQGACLEHGLAERMGIQIIYEQM